MVLITKHRCHGSHFDDDVSRDLRGAVAEDHDPQHLCWCDPRLQTKRELLEVPADRLYERMVHKPGRRDAPFRRRSEPGQGGRHVERVGRGPGRRVGGRFGSQYGIASAAANAVTVAAMAPVVIKAHGKPATRAAPLKLTPHSMTLPGNPAAVTIWSWVYRVALVTTPAGGPPVVGMCPL